MWTGAMSDVPKALNDVDGGNFEVVIADTPPALGQREVKLLLRRASLVLVPTTQGVMDLKASIAWMTFLRTENAKAAFLINRAQRTFGSYQRAKLRLLKFGPLCPVDVRLLDDVAAAGDLGLGVLEMAKSRAAEDYQGVWSFCCQQMGIRL
jgi:chromosome partitioning protein